MGRGTFSARSSALALTAALAGCGAAPDYGAAEVQLPPAQAPGVIIRVGDGGRYPIRLGWPATAGSRSRFHVEIDDTSTTSAKASGKDDVETKHKTLSADGVAETLAVDDATGATKLDLALDRLDAEGWGASAKLHLEHALLHVERAPTKVDAVVTVDGSPASATEREIVDDMFALETSTTPSDDDAFGTGDLVAPGGRWQIRRERVRKAFSKGEVHIPEGAATGEMLLRNVVDRGGVQALDITGVIDIQPFELSTALPGDGRLERSSIHAVSHVVVPTTPGPRFEDDLDLSIELAFATPAGGLFESTSRRVSKRTNVPL